MKSWKEYQTDAGHVDDNPPEIKQTWVGYKAGEVKHFANKFEALKFSKNVEFIQDADGLKAVDAYWKSKKQIDDAAFGVWFEDLEKEHSELSSEVFDLCYNEASDRGHHAGYDETASIMDDVVVFAKNIIEASNGRK